MRAARLSNYYSNAELALAPGTQALTANVLRAYPMWLEPRMTIDELRAQASTGVAATNFRLGIYTDAGGYPGSLVVETGQLDGAITTVQTVAITPATLVGTYWVAYLANGAPTLRAVALGALPTLLGFNPAMGTNSQYTGWTVAQAYGAMPATYPGGGTLLANTASPLLLMRVTALNP